MKLSHLIFLGSTLLLNNSVYSKILNHQIKITAFEDGICEQIQNGKTLDELLTRDDTLDYTSDAVILSSLNNSLRKNGYNTNKLINCKKIKEEFTGGLWPAFSFLQDPIYTYTADIVSGNQAQSNCKTDNIESLKEVAIENNDWSIVKLYENTDKGKKQLNKSISLLSKLGYIHLETINGEYRGRQNAFYLNELKVGIKKCKKNAP